MSDLGANNNIMSPYSQTVITERESKSDNHSGRLPSGEEKERCQ